MPIFDFYCDHPECPNYTGPIELFVGRDEVPACESCKSPLLKLISAASFVLKGRGWTGQEIKLDNKTRKAMEG